MEVFVNWITFGVSVGASCWRASSSKGASSLPKEVCFEERRTFQSSNAEWLVDEMTRERLTADIARSPLTKINESRMQTHNSWCSQRPRCPFMLLPNIFIETRFPS